ncbi:hypothetical protein BGZ74_008410 [Mortierella antarctica]|nr:hypothetical protein BGZ74_008410 [Mortierella antarctica]
MCMTRFTSLLMLRNIMTDNHLNLFCLIDGESSPFSVKAFPDNTVHNLKDAIKAKKTNGFSDVDADKLICWRVTILVSDDNDNDNDER